MMEADQVSAHEHVDERPVVASAFEQLPDVLRTTLERRGFSKLTPVQEAVAAADTESRDLRISSQTGSGKTVAIGIAVARELLRLGVREQGQGPSVLVLTPTRELAAQVQRELGWLLQEIQDGFVEVVTGGTSVGFERKRLARNPRLVVGTPGRVLDHLENNGFSGDNVSQVILDEADQMLDLGFKDELDAILGHLPVERRTHFVSATFSGEVLRAATRHQSQPLALHGTPLGEANSDIQHVAHVVPFRHRHDALVNVLLATRAQNLPEANGRTLVFTRTRQDVLETAERLQREGFRAEPMSGDLAQAQRTRTLAAFRAGAIEVVVATDVAARGLDVDGIDLVVHLEPPSDADTFTHRSGRTGRAGSKGTSVVIMPPQARGRVERLMHQARIQANFAPVPGPDKIKKLFSKIAKRQLHSAMEGKPAEDHVEYAKKLLEENPPEQVVAHLLAMCEVAPPCPAREISAHIGVEQRARHPRPDSPRGRGGPRAFGGKPGFNRGGPRRGPGGPPGARAGAPPGRGGPAGGARPGKKTFKGKGPKRG